MFSDAKSETHKLLTVADARVRELRREVAARFSGDELKDLWKCLASVETHIDNTIRASAIGPPLKKEVAADVLVSGKDKALAACKTLRDVDLDVSALENIGL